MKKYSIDHVCLYTKDLDATVRMFTEVFGMEVFKTGGAAPARKVWLDGGIQLNEAGDFEAIGGMDHYAINVSAGERKEIFEKLAAFGCSQVEGLQEISGSACRRDRSSSYRM